MPLCCEIRPSTENELPLLDAHLDPNRLAGRHADRLRQQQQGRLTYLVAWHGGVPIGHTIVRWTGALDEFVMRRIRNCAHIEDLFVMPKHRSQGVGGRILACAERLAAERGFRQIGLAVGIDNPRARSLYERSDYADTGFGVFRIGGSYRDTNGNLRHWQEDCEYLVKRLSPTPHSGAGQRPPAAADDGEHDKPAQE